MNSSAMTGKLLARQTWYPHEHRLVTEGIRAYTSVPMNVRSGLLGTAGFSRRTPVGFDQDQVSLLSDVSRALAVAVINALANEEIRALRDQLEAENAASTCITRSAMRSSLLSASLTAAFPGPTAQPSGWDFRLRHSNSESNGSASTSSRFAE
jgi:GAF domain-containing protein